MQSSRLSQALARGALCLIVGAAAASTACKHASSSSAAAHHGPAIACAEPHRDFGSVTEGTLLKHVFVVRNAGDATLTIQQAQGT